MLLIFWKCKCLHARHGIFNVNSELEDTILGITIKEKELTVTVNADVKASEQCGIAASKGNQILGLIELD